MAANIAALPDKSITHMVPKTAKQLPAPGYIATKALYPSIYGLKEELGFQDASIQLAQLASQVLAEVAAHSPLGPDEYLRQEFLKRGIPHGTHDFTHLANLSCRSYVVQTYALVDKTLRALAREYRGHKWLDDVWVANDTEGEAFSPVDLLIKNVDKRFVKELQSKPEVELIEYYRLTRVSIVHPTSEARDAAASCSSALQKNHPTYFSAIYELVAPNPPDALTFEDFRLLTRAFKYVANVFNDACDLHPDDIPIYVKQRDPAALDVLMRSKRHQLGALQRYVEGRHGLQGKATRVDQAMLEFVRLRGELMGQLKAANGADSKSVRRVSPLRNGSYIIRRTYRGPKETRPKEEVTPSMALDEAIAHLQSLVR